MHAASRNTTNSNPSLEMRVTYLLEPCFWLELAMTDDLEGNGLMLKERGLHRRELQAAKREALFYEST